MMISFSEEKLKAEGNHSENWEEKEETITSSSKIQRVHLNLCSLCYKVEPKVRQSHHQASASHWRNCVVAVGAGWREQVNFSGF